jgi:hypothetical protein
LWFQACVVRIHHSKCVSNGNYKKDSCYVHFIGWNYDFDERVSFSRIRPFSPHTDIGPKGPESVEAIRREYALKPVPALSPEHVRKAQICGIFCAVERCDALDSDGVWYDAVVVKGSTREDPSIKVHYSGWPKSSSRAIKRKLFSTHLRPHSGSYAFFKAWAKTLHVLCSPQLSLSHAFEGTCEVGPRGYETLESIAAIYGYTLQTVAFRSNLTPNSDGTSELDTSSEFDAVLVKGDRGNCSHFNKKKEGSVLTKSDLQNDEQRESSKQCEAATGRQSKGGRRRRRDGSSADNGVEQSSIMSDDVASGEEALRRSGHVSTASDRASARNTCGRQVYFAALEYALQTSLNAIVRIESATIYSKLSHPLTFRTTMQFAGTIGLSPAQILPISSCPQEAQCRLSMRQFVTLLRLFSHREPLQAVLACMLA